MPEIKFFLVFISSLVFASLSCKSVNVYNEQKSQTIEEIAATYLTNPHIELNSTRDFALCYESKSSDVAAITKYIIIRTADKKIILNGSYRRGYIKWINATEVELLDAPFIFVPDDELDSYKRFIPIIQVEN